MIKIILCILFCTSLSAESKYPVDVSHVIADIKFSQENGVKICEIQHGILSAFRGDAFANGNDGVISPEFVNFFAQIPVPKWTMPRQIAYKKLAGMLQDSPDWNTRNSMDAILTDPDFYPSSQILPTDPSSIDSYYGMVYVQSPVVRNYDQFRQKFPGIIIIDAATHPYWIDKYKMSLLFKNHPVLAAIKPEWQLYPKQYTETLALQIQHDIPSDFFVIKPRSSCVGNGVIIVSKEELDSTLQFILNRSPELQYHHDNSYNYWFQDPHHTFLVEKYYHSDNIQVPHFENNTYEPTIRVAFIMKYDKGTISHHYLGAYYTVPFKSIDEEGTLNERKKAYCKPPHYYRVSDEVLNQVLQQLDIAIPLLYKEMLRG